MFNFITKYLRRKKERISKSRLLELTQQLYKENIFHLIIIIIIIIILSLMQIMGLAMLSFTDSIMPASFIFDTKMKTIFYIFVTINIPYLCIAIYIYRKRIHLITIPRKIFFCSYFFIFLFYCIYICPLTVLIIQLMPLGS